MGWSRAGPPYADRLPLTGGFLLTCLADQGTVRLLGLALKLCLLLGPRRRSRVFVGQAAQNLQTLIRNPAKGEQGSLRSPESGPAKPPCVGSSPTVAS